MHLDINSLPYRPCVGIALFNKDGLVFVGERIDAPGAWQMPQGGIDAGEDLKTAAFRELAEEVGTQKASIIRIADKTIKYDIPLAVLKNSRKGGLWDMKYCGQEQTWVAMRFEGQDDDINLNSHTEQEFSNWRWVPLEDTPNLIVPFKKDVYVSVVQMFSDVAGA